MTNGVNNGKGGKRRRKPVLEMRQCALPECKIAFYPLRAWQKFHDPKCAVKDRQRRLRERYRKLIKMNSGDITAGVGGRKTISRRGSREISRAEADIIESIRRIGQPAMDAVTAVLAGQLPSANPEPAAHSPPGGSRMLMPRRLRNIRVHPRSLEKQ